MKKFRKPFHETIIKVLTIFPASLVLKTWPPEMKFAQSLLCEPKNFKKVLKTG